MSDSAKIYKLDLCCCHYVCQKKLSRLTWLRTPSTFIICKYKPNEEPSHSEEMFKKAKAKELTPPRPPTFAQILEDMETFVIEKSPIERIRSLPNTSPAMQQTTESKTEVTNIASTSDLGDWWKVFETFNSDNEDLQSIRRKLIACQKLLDERKNEIKSKTDSIQRDIDVHLQDPPIDVNL